MYEFIKRLAKEKGIAIAELEKKAEIGSNSIWRWDQNIPSIDKVARVAEVLGVTLDEIYRGKVGEETKEDIIEKAFERPEMRMLFSMCENAPAEDINYVIAKLEKLKG